jgi:hypothetical protein
MGMLPSQTTPSRAGDPAVLTKSVQYGHGEAVLEGYLAWDEREGERAAYANHAKRAWA